MLICSKIQRFEAGCMPWGRFVRFWPHLSVFVHRDTGFLRVFFGSFPGVVRKNIFFSEGDPKQTRSEPEEKYPDFKLRQQEVCCFYRK